MGDHSRIEWTEATWNPLAGCSPVSEGCRNCYAAKEAVRLAGNPNEKIAAKYAGTAEMRGVGEKRRAVFTGRVNTAPDVLDQPLRWKRPRRIFVNSMSDLFHEAVPFETIDRVFETMRLAHWHTFQILTKRPEWMAEYVISRRDRSVVEGVLGVTWESAHAHIWVGTSVENQTAADERIPYLLRTPAAVRFLSCEPLLGPVDLSRWMPPGRVQARCSGCGTYTSDPRSLSGCKGYCYDETGKSCDAWPCPTCGRFHYWCGSHVGNGCPNEQPLSWVIAGGESGPGARPMHPDWARSLRDQCTAAGVPYFFKQWGEYAPSTWQAPDATPHHGYISPEGAGEPLPRPADGVTCYGPLSLEERGCACVDRVGKKAAGRELDGRTWDGMPEVVHG